MGTPVFVGEGIIELERQQGQGIRVYKTDPVLVECLSPVYQVAIQTRKIFTDEKMLKLQV